MDIYCVRTITENTACQTSHMNVSISTTLLTILLTKVRLVCIYDKSMHYIWTLNDEVALITDNNNLPFRPLTVTFRKLLYKKMYSKPNSTGYRGNPTKMGSNDESTAKTVCFRWLDSM